MNIFIRFVSVLLILLLTAGCYTQTPKPVSYEYSTQKKMQAAHHWDILAQDVVCQIKVILAKAGYINQPVYVKPACGASLGLCAPHNESSFDEGFYDLLVSNLVNEGIQVSIEEKGALVVTNKVQVVYHTENRRTRPAPPGFITAAAAVVAGLGWVIRDAREYGGWQEEGLAWGLAGVAGAGMYDYMSGRFTTLPHSEVLITTSIKDYNRYLMRKTDIYYINDPDYWHYKTPPPPQTVEITGS